MNNLGKDITVEVRFQNSLTADVDVVIPVSKSWTWSTLLTEVGNRIDVVPESISHLVLLNKTGSEISLHISDFAKFKRILNMYSTPSEMKFNVLFSKTEEKKKSLRLRFRLSSNIRRNLDITVPEEASWSEITDLISTEFSVKDPINHLILVNREGESVSKSLNTAESFWSVASTFNIEKDGVFVAYSGAEQETPVLRGAEQRMFNATGRSPARKSPHRNGGPLRPSSVRAAGPPAPLPSPPVEAVEEDTKETANVKPPQPPALQAARDTEVPGPLVLPMMDPPAADDDEDSAPPPTAPPSPAVSSAEKTSPAEKVGPPQATSAQQSSISPDDSCSSPEPDTTQEDEPAEEEAMQAKAQQPLLVGATPPRAFKDKPLPTQPVMALFCLSDDMDSPVKVVLSDFESWTGLLDAVCTAFGLNKECVLYFFLVDKDNDELSPFLRNAEKFWRIYNKKYSLEDRKKFVVEVDQKKRQVNNSFSVLVKLSPECEHLSPTNPVRNVSFPRDCSWDGISKALTTEYGLPAVSVHHFIVIDSDGDEMSPHLSTVETFWKAASTFARDHGDALSVHLDELAIKESSRELERKAFLEHAARFNIALDCDQANRGECLVAENAPWTDIVRGIVTCLSLTNGSAIQKVVLVDADGTPLSPDIKTDRKFWKIYNIKYKNSPNSCFMCTFLEPSRQKAFFDLCATGTQTASLLDLMRKGVDVNAIFPVGSVAGSTDDEAEQRAVHLAAKGGHAPTLRVLCSLECLNVQCLDASGRTPLFLACQAGSGECVQLLIDKGATFSGQDVQGKTALHVLAMHGFEVVKNQEQRLRDVFRGRVTVQQVNAFDNSCCTPLMYACKRGDSTVAKLLVEFGAIVNLRDKEGMSPLLHAVGSGSYKLLTYLLQQKPNISARNNNGDDALLLTAATNNQRMAECLIGREMDVQTRNYIGQSLYQVAASASCPTLAQWFAAQGAGKTALTSKAQRHLFQTDQSLEKRLRAEEIKHAETILGGPIKVYAENLITVMATEVGVAAITGKFGGLMTDAHEQGASKTLRKTVHFKLQNMSLQLAAKDEESSVKTDLFNACKCGDIDRVREICRVFGEKVDICNIRTTAGDTLLHIACYVGNLELCKFLHRQGIAVSAKDSSGYTPFHCVCEEGLFDIAAWMVTIGASCALVDDKMMTPIHYACQHQRVDIIKVLAMIPDCSLSAKDKDGMVPMQYITQWKNVPVPELEAIILELLQGKASDVERAATLLLPDVAASGLLKIVEYILDMGCCSVNAKAPEDGQSAMHRACRGGKLDLVKLLVRRKADMTLRDYSEMTPFLHACSSGNLELVKYLASSGPKGILLDMDSNGDNALHFCTRTHDTEMVKWLLQRGLDCNQPNFKRCAAVDLPEASDWSELKLVYREHQMVQVAPKPKDRRLVSYVDRDALSIYEICSSGVHDELYALVESGDNLDVELTDGSGYTALHIACERGNYSVVAMLTKNGCHFNREASNGETPLYLACKNGHINVARILVELGVDCHEPVADSTLLHAAAGSCHYDIVCWLVDVGVSVDVIDASGFTAMHIASRDNAMETVQRLFDLGGNIDVHGINAPLHVACFVGNIDVAKWLVGQGASPDALHEGRNAFLIACSGGQKDVAIWLDSIGADITCVNEEDGLTALHRACMMEDVALAEWLLSRNPDFIKRRAVDDKSPLSVAVLSCNDELVDLCERYIMDGTDEDTALDEIRDDIIDLLGIAMQEEDFSAAPFMLQRLMLHTDPLYVFSDGSTVLHFAAAIGDLEVLSYLLSHNAVVDARSHAQKTPLHYAAITGEIKCAEKLINAGADCLAKDSSDRDIMQFAQYFKRRLFLKWLRRFSPYIEATTPQTGSFLFACLPVGSAAAQPGLTAFSESDGEGGSKHSSVHTSDDVDPDLDSSIYPSL